MIAEDVLERGLADAAASYDVPDSGLDRLRELLAPAIETPQEQSKSWRSWRNDKRMGLLAIAAALVALIAIPVAIGGSGGSDRGDAVTATSGGSNAPTLGGANGANEQKSAITDYSDAQDRDVAGGAPVPMASPAAGVAAGSATTTGSTHQRTDVAVPKAPIPAPANSAKIIKTGELDLQVAKGDVSHTLDRLAGIATLMRGYVSDSRTSEGGGAPSGVVTMRVPVDNFENAVSRARGLGKVLALETSGDDVTGKYVDLKARIKALEATRRTFTTILSRATTIGETLAVQDRITQVQTQIEQLQGQAKVLASQSALSTLTVTVDQKFLAHTATAHEDNGMVKAVKLSVSRFVRGIEAIIGVIGPILLVVLLIGLGWIGARLGYRTLRRRMV